MDVFVLGITGRTGVRIARSLVEQGHSISGLIRHPHLPAELSKRGVTAMQGDIATISADDLAKMMRGADAVVFAAGAGEQGDELMLDAVDYGGVVKTIAAMKRAGVSRLLAISVFPEAAREQCLGDSFEHYISAKKKADVAVVNSKLDWLILRPSSLTEDSGTGRVSLALANFHTQISRDDLAATAVALLLEFGITAMILEATAGNQRISEAVSAMLPSKSFSNQISEA